jgi:hypothetical protein
MAKVAPAFKSSLQSAPVKVAMQGGHGSSDAVTQKTSIQDAPSSKATGKSDIKFTVQPSGTRGSNPGAK